MYKNLFTVIFLISATACSTPSQEMPKNNNVLCNKVVLNIANSKARDEFYELDDYKITRISLDSEKSIWTVYYDLRSYPLPGSHFHVTIDNESLVAELFKGE